MNNDYILRSILNTQRFISHLDKMAEEQKVWDEEIQRLAALQAKAKEANA